MVVDPHTIRVLRRARHWQSLSRGASTLVRWPLSRSSWISAASPRAARSISHRDVAQSWNRICAGHRRQDLRSIGPHAWRVEVGGRVGFDSGAARTLCHARNMAIASSEAASPTGATRTKRAEFSLIVRSDLKGLGLGKLLFDQLIEHARSRGIAGSWDSCCARTPACSSSLAPWDSRSTRSSRNSQECGAWFWYWTTPSAKFDAPQAGVYATGAPCGIPLQKQECRP